MRTATTKLSAGSSGHQEVFPWKWVAIFLACYIAVDTFVLSGKSGSKPLSGNDHGSDSLGLGGARLLAESESHEGDHDDGDHSDHGEHGHPHEAMFFLVGAIIIGSLTSSLGMLKIFQCLQQSVLLFVLGVIAGVFFEGLGLKDKLGPVGRSYSMWVAMDPHLLLYTMLPPLLAGDAMTIDTHVAMKVVRQCIYLAGFGVLASALVTAVFLWGYLPYDWDFMLCLTTGSILCATDPVAVVALLKELGASPTLTVQIQGESLLNDGTAIVLFRVAYQMLAGQEYDHGQVMMFLVKTALYAWIWGVIIGMVFLFWIRAVKNRFSHGAGMLQVALTLACAYSSFLVAEGIFNISGVLATVSSSLVLAHKMWPEVVDPETMHTVWHMLEYLGNTVVFVLAGALTGNMMVKIHAMDYLHLLVIYLALLVIRGGLILASRPVLGFLSKDRQTVPISHALVMTWGGLRGAVGLALAIEVSIGRAAGEDGVPRIGELDGDRVLFYVGGVALLTLVVNASTCPLLVQQLGITKTPEDQVKLMRSIHEQLKSTAPDASHPEPVQRFLVTMLERVGSELELPEDNGQRESRRALAGPTLPERAAIGGRVSMMILGGENPSAGMQTAGDLFKELDKLQEAWINVDQLDKERVQKMAPMPVFDRIKTFSDQLKGGMLDNGLLKAINKAFLHLLKKNYWNQMQKGLLSTSEAHVLMHSVTFALSQEPYDLRDLHEVAQMLEWNPDYLEGAKMHRFSLPKVKTKADLDNELESLTPAQKLVKMDSFNMFIMVTVIFNTVFVFIEDVQELDNNNIGLLVIEIIFTTLFTVELVVKLVADGKAYFTDVWNHFDAALVLVGWVGVAFQLMSVGNGVGAKETQLTRIAKIFKTLRAFRLIRLIHLCRRWAENRLAGKISKPKLALHMKQLDVVVGFVRGHVECQEQLLKYFGENNPTCTSEVSRCILQSMEHVIRALLICAYEEHMMQEKDSTKPKEVDELLSELANCQKSIDATRALEDFIRQAREGGVLSAREAEHMIHPMHENVEHLMERAQDIRRGRSRKAGYKSVGTFTKAATIAKPLLADDTPMASTSTDGGLVCASQLGKKLDQIDGGHHEDQLEDQLSAHSGQPEDEPRPDSPVAQSRVAPSLPPADNDELLEQSVQVGHTDSEHTDHPDDQKEGDPPEAPKAAPKGKAKGKRKAKKMPRPSQGGEAQWE